MKREPAIELTETDPPHNDGPWDPNVPATDAAGWDNVTATPSAPTTPARAPVPKADARRFRIVPRTLTNRLVAGVVALVTVLVVATGTATYFALRSFLFNRLDQQLAPVLQANEHKIDGCLNSPVRTCVLDTGNAGFRSPQKQWLVVLDEQGNTFGSVTPSANLLPMQLSKSERSKFVSDPTSVRTIETTDGARLRVSGRVVSAPDKQYVVVTGLSTGEVSNTLHQLFVIELAIGAGAIGIAFLATMYGVRLSLRPLRRVTRTAREVTAELSPEGAGLDRRVPVAPSEVDSEAGQMAQSVNTLLGAVETEFKARVESEERMRQFLADASHELRTPLTSIRGYAELSRMRRAIGDAPDDADTLDRIESEGTRMSRLVDDLLTLARTDQGTPPDREPVDVGQLIKEAVDGARAAYPHRRIDTTAANGMVVLGDHDQLLRILRNLITNAAVHTDPHGSIRVWVAREGDQIALRVADAGPGLPPDQVAHVFERFWRADKARSRARGGSGLGLSIVSAIVDAHGGTVSFDSSVQGGSTVTVRLPG
jgi:two-component system OmpR family sensor kinase